MSALPARHPQSVGRLLWLRICLATPDARARAIYHHGASPADHSAIYLHDIDGRDRAMLRWLECAHCQRGHIAKISVGYHWQRRGIGRMLVTWVMDRRPGYAWTTSGQSPDGQPFFAAMRAETGAAFTDRSKPCPHMRSRPWENQGPNPRAPRPKVLVTLSMACSAAVERSPSAED